MYGRGLYILLATLLPVRDVAATLSSLMTHGMEIIVRMTMGLPSKKELRPSNSADRVSDFESDGRGFESLLGC